MVRLLRISILLTMLVIIFIGCSATNDFMLDSTAIDKKGSIIFSTVGPSTSSRLPATTNSFTVILSQGATQLASKTLNQQKAVTSCLLIDALPEGLVHFSITAFEGEQGKGLSLGTAEGATVIQNGQQAKIDMDSLVYSAISK